MHIGGPKAHVILLGMTGLLDVTFDRRPFTALSKPDLVDFLSKSI